MKAALLLDLYANAGACTEEQRLRLTFLQSKDGPVAIFAKGSIVSGDEALIRCQTGQASPLDEQCRLACGMTDDQMTYLQTEYKMATLGVNDKDDKELYRAGIILGYDEKLNYIPGPNWAAYQAAKAEIEKTDDIE